MPLVEKRPRVVATDFYQLRPSWRVGLLELVDPYGWHALVPAKIEHVRGKLAQFESMTWAQILIQGKHWNHLVSIDKICAPARGRLQELGQDDIDEVVSLRLSNLERVWGIQESNVLKLLWWDPLHQICPSLQ